ncbi:Histidine kinase OS=Streptomyces rutgersensis OX=53451 GN=F0345_05360 PE=4 SV=1 [Streptomyces diastaticus subsp. diastaticus]
MRRSRFTAVEDVAAAARHDAGAMTSTHDTSRPRVPAVPGRTDRAAAWLAVLACLPYLTLKTAWVAGSPVGIPPGSPLLDHSLVLRLANAGTVVMDGAVIVLVLLLVRPWGLRAPWWLLLVPAWIATGLLLPIVLGYPAQLLAGLLGASGGEAEPFLANWVFAVVYGGFIVQALALGTLFARYVARRWPDVVRARLGGLRPGGSQRAPQWLAAGTLALTPLPLALQLAWAAGASAGLDAPGSVNSRVVAATHACALLLAVAGTLSLTWRRPPRLPLGVPLAATWLGSGATLCWALWMLLPMVSGAAADETSPLLLLVHLVRTLVGALAGAGLVVALRARAGRTGTRGAA